MSKSKLVEMNVKTIEDNGRAVAIEVSVGSDVARYDLGHEPMTAIEEMLDIAYYGGQIGCKVNKFTQKGSEDENN